MVPAFHVPVEIRMIWELDDLMIMFSNGLHVVNMSCKFAVKFFTLITIGGAFKVFYKGFDIC